MKLWVYYIKDLETSESSHDRYGDYVNWSEVYNYSVKSVNLSRIVGNYDYDEFEVPFDVVEGDEVFVVYARYSDGDSFGTARGKGEIIEVFKDKKLADLCVGIVNQLPEYEEKIRYPISDNQFRVVQNIFRDHFVDLDFVDIEKLKVQK